MRWFRRKPAERTTEPAPEQAVQPDTVETPAADAAADTPPSSAASRRRRRGSRGGRNRRKPGELRAHRGEGGTARKGPEGGEEAGAKPREALIRQTRRRTATRALPPPAKRDLVISVDVAEQRVAILEDDKVAEVYLERLESRSIAGNIYKGTVDNVLPGMEAAFVEIGLEKNGFLYVDEIVTARGAQARPQDPGPAEPRRGDPRPGRHDPMKSKVPA